MKWEGCKFDYFWWRIVLVGFGYWFLRSIFVRIVDFSSSLMSLLWIYGEKRRALETHHSLLGLDAHIF